MVPVCTVRLARNSQGFAARDACQPCWECIIAPLPPPGSAFYLVCAIRWERPGGGVHSLAESGAVRGVHVRLYSALLDTTGTAYILHTAQAVSQPSRTTLGVRDGSKADKSVCSIPE